VLSHTDEAQIHPAAEEDPRAKYRELPPSVDSADVVVEVDTDVTAVEHAGHPEHNSGADPYRRIAGWLQH
jgi:hypothetical protein